ncbi:hypothetical protein BKA66DRAFT_215193 [Pyrenochaeta sp. MPI-SDFR-AT-0127]|nr:hypothetical protein BKA66DRAFT_215193 [Pyrenochaeta sp. MPI-SDFR-AT-0127]
MFTLDWSKENYYAQQELSRVHTGCRAEDRHRPLRHKPSRHSKNSSAAPRVHRLYITIPPLQPLTRFNTRLLILPAANALATVPYSPEPRFDAGRDDPCFVGVSACSAVRLTTPETPSRLWEAVHSLLKGEGGSTLNTSRWRSRVDGRLRCPVPLRPAVSMIVIWAWFARLIRVKRSYMIVLMPRPWWLPNISVSLFVRFDVAKFKKYPSAHSLLRLELL